MFAHANSDLVLGDVWDWVLYTALAFFALGAWFGAWSATRKKD